MFCLLTAFRSLLTGQLYEDEEAKTEAKLLGDALVVDDSEISCIVAQPHARRIGA
jgi:hypothetical protein